MGRLFAHGFSLPDDTRGPAVEANAARVERERVGKRVEFCAKNSVEKKNKEEVGEARGRLGLVEGSRPLLTVPSLSYAGRRQFYASASGKAVSQYESEEVQSVSALALELSIEIKGITDGAMS